MGDLGPLRATGIGMVLVVADFRFNGLDVLPDPLGWLTAVVAGFALGRVHPGFQVATVAAIVAAALAVPDAMTPNTGWLAVADTVVACVFIVATCTAIAATSARRARTASLLRWWYLGLTLAGLVVGQVATASLAWEPLVVAMAVTGLVVVLWFVVLLFQTAGDAPVAVVETP